jgi:DNA-binding response OmpR family regulator
MIGKKIVILDDEPNARELLKDNLSKEGYISNVFEDPSKALSFLKTNHVDIILTDWLMPGMDGLEFCRILKRDPKTENIPIIMISCKNEEIDVVTALELGVDDYMAKPFRIKELISRIKKVLHKYEYTPQLAEDNKTSGNYSNREPNDIIVYNDLKIDLSAHTAYIGEKILNLTNSEFKLLVLFARMPGRVLSRGQIIEMINGNEYIVTERAIDVQMVGLRKKLGEYKDYIETVRSVGYKFSV